MSVASVTTLLTVCFLTAADMDFESGMSGTEISSDAISVDLPQGWMHSYEEAKKTAARNKLPLLLHFDATWCGACRRMEQDVLQREEVTTLLGRSVVGVRIDADQHKELISEFGISTLPTEVVVLADGSLGDRYVGAVALDEYVSRLKSVSGQNKTAIADRQDAKTADSADTEKASDTKRSCLIVLHDDKMVGLGGYSPVALTSQRLWKKGSDQFVASHEGVDYFLQSADEVEQFQEDPKKYIPKLHGCDLVELFQENRATAGSIEFGAFYQGQTFFFASLANRERFESNPTWFLGVMADARTANNEQFPFLKTDYADN